MPNVTQEMEYQTLGSMYATTFYLSFGSGNSTVAFKVMNKKKDESKMYKIVLTKQLEKINKVQIYKEAKFTRFLFGVYETSNVVASNEINIETNEGHSGNPVIVGVWVK